jgi:hypothetical protein
LWQLSFALEMCTPAPAARKGLYLVATG